MSVVYVGVAKATKDTKMRIFGLFVEKLVIWVVILKSGGG